MHKSSLLFGLKAIFLERFKPLSYGPMIILFTTMNGLYFAQSQNVSSNLQGAIVALFIMFCAFFRLRLFDEIKDYHVDLKINPQRPLARGIISIDQVRLSILFLIVTELTLAYWVNPFGFLIHALAVGYSLLMFEEFFIGRWLRSHLTTYAITHTFVSVFYALSAAVLWTQSKSIELTNIDILYFVSNWFYFNLFEFSRKTYATEEERPGVETYSSLFGAQKAAALSFSQALLAAIYYLYFLRQPLQTLSVAIFLIYTLLAVLYGFYNRPHFAKLFRAASGLYLLLQYLILTLFYGGIYAS
ncbi:MAG: UbiA family prenyltransferase [Pseudobdellovibrionaceae bacterium]